MNQMQIFENQEFGQVRAVEIDGEPWFVGKDIATVLGYSNASKAVSVHVDSDDKQFIMVEMAESQNGNVPIGSSKTAFINESGLYSLVLSSKLPSAKKFKRWVTSEVLPSIRKTGGYHLPQTYSEALRALADTVEEKERLALENTEMKPKAEYYDGLVEVNMLTTFRDTAKELHIKETEFIQTLLDKKYVYRDTKGILRPYAKYSGDLFECRDWANFKTGKSGVKTMITVKGKKKFLKLFSNK